MNFAPFAFQNSTPVPGIVTDNLSLYYDAGNPTSYPGSISWFNLQPTTLTSTLTNGPTFSTNNGGVIVFDGTNDFTTAPNNAMFDFGSGDFTLEAWVKINGNSAVNGSGNRDATILSCFTTGGSIPNAWNFQFNGTSGTTGTGLRLQKYESSAVQDIQVSFRFTQNVFYQVGVVRRGATTRLFINGVEYTPGINITGNVNSGGNPFRISTLAYAGFLHNFNGTVGIVRIYKGTGLTAAQILQNYNADSSRVGLTVVTTNLQLYLNAGIAGSYPGTGTAWNDLSGNGNNLTLVNGPVWSSSNGGYFTFDGTNDHVSNYTYGTTFSTNQLTYQAVLNYSGKTSYNNIFDTFNSVNPMMWVDPSNRLELNQAALVSALSYNTQNIMVTFVQQNANPGLRLYINTTLVGTVTTAQGTIPNSRFNFFRRESAGQFYQGRAYAVLMYNRALTIDEITNNYNLFKTTFPI